MKPGIASFFMPKSGTHQAWITSAAVTSSRTFTPAGHDERVVDVQQVVLDGVRVDAGEELARRVALRSRRWKNRTS